MMYSMTIFSLMESGMTYEEATIYQFKICAIMLTIVLVVCFMEKLTKKYCPKIYQKLKQYNFF